MDDGTQDGHVYDIDDKYEEDIDDFYDPPRGGSVCMSDEVTLRSANVRVSKSSGEEEKERGQDVDEGKKSWPGREDRASRGAKGSRSKGSLDTGSVRGSETRSRRRRRSVETRSGRSRGSRGGQRARSGTSWAGREQVHNHWWLSLWKISTYMLKCFKYILKCTKNICEKV